MPRSQSAYMAMTAVCRDVTAGMAGNLKLCEVGAIHTIGSKFQGFLVLTSVVTIKEPFIKRKTNNI